MSNKFLSTGQTNVTNGSVDIYGSTLGAVNLAGNEAVLKTNTNGLIVRGSLTGSEISGIVENPSTADIDVNEYKINNVDSLVLTDGTNNATIRYQNGTGDINIDAQTIQEIDTVTQNFNLSTSDGQTDITGDVVIDGDLQYGGALIGDLVITDINIPSQTTTLGVTDTTVSNNIATGNGYLSNIEIDADDIRVATESIDTKIPTLSQKTMAGSLPVVLASDQSTVSVSDASTQTILSSLDTNIISVDGKIPALGKNVESESLSTVLSSSSVGIPQGLPDDFPYTVFESRCFPIDYQQFEFGDTPTSPGSYTRLNPGIADRRAMYSKLPIYVEENTWIDYNCCIAMNTGPAGSGCYAYAGIGDFTSDGNYGGDNFIGIGVNATVDPSQIAVALKADGGSVSITNSTSFIHDPGLSTSSWSNMKIRIFTGTPMTICFYYQNGTEASWKLLHTIRRTHVNGFPANWRCGVYINRASGEFSNPFIKQCRISQLTKRSKEYLQDRISDGFGRNVYAEYSPLFHYSFNYSVNPRVWDEYQNVANITIEGSLSTGFDMSMVLAAGGTGSCYVIGKQPISYQNGQSMEMIIAARFPTSTWTAADESNSFAGFGLGSTINAQNTPYSGFGFCQVSGNKLVAAYNVGSTTGGIGNSVDITMPDWLDINSYNVYKLRLSWLGVARQEWFVLHPYTYEFHRLHIRSQLGTTTLLSSYNNLAPYIGLGSSDGSTTGGNMYLKCTSVGVGINGKVDNSYPPRCIVRNIPSSGTPIDALAIENITTFNSKENTQSFDIIKVQLAVTNSAANTSHVEVYTNAIYTPTGATDVENDVSIARYNVPTGVSGGRLVAGLPLGNDGSGAIDIKPGDIRLNPGDNVLFRIVLSGGTATAVLIVTIQEDL